MAAVNASRRAATLSSVPSEARISFHRSLLIAFRRLPVALRRWLIRHGTPHYTAGAVVLLYRNPSAGDVGQLLLVYQTHTGLWALPGGLLKRREAPLAAACREVREETGIDIDPADVRPATPAINVDAKAHRIDMIYLAVCPDEAQVTLDSIETIDAKWMDADAKIPDCTGVTRDILSACTALPG